MAISSSGFRSENDFSKILNKNFNFNTRIYRLDTQSSTSQNSDISQDSDTFFGRTKMSSENSYYEWLQYMI